MDERSNSFGYWLRRRRKALDLTQSALAQKVSCSPAAIKKIEAEERKPSKGLAERLADQLAIPAPERAAFLQAARSPLTGSGLRLSQFPLDASTGSPTAMITATALPHAPHIASMLGQLADDDQASPFIGRLNEYGHLLGLLARLTTGSGQVVLIEGEAGIGKSRLMHEVAAYARQRGLPTLSTNCYEIERAIAYQPIIELATQAWQAAPTRDLQAIAPTLLAEVAALLPAMADRLGDLPPLSADFPEARQARLFHALTALFGVLAQGHQLLLMVDDLQWADAASLRFLHFLARQISKRPMLLVCAYREEELGSNEELASLLKSLRSEAPTQHMALARLGLGDTQALLAELNAPHLKNAPDLAARLHRETDGNPFFLWSILHSLAEGEYAAQDDTQALLPEALRDSVRLRLARVPQPERELLNLAAVLGRRFDFETLLALSPVPEQGFLQAMESLVTRRLLRELPEVGDYDFNHDKVREVVYRDMGAARRVLLHRSVVAMLEQPPISTAHEHTARLAEHCERGHLWPQALHYLGLAAAQSQQLFAMREALQWLDRAIALVQAHPEAASQAEQLVLLERRGAARAQAGQVEGAVADFQRVIEAARASGEQAHARDTLIQLGMAYRRADAFEQALACLDEALQASRAMGDEGHAADTLYHLGTVAWSNGRNDLAIGYHSEAVAICERLHRTDLVAVQAFHGRGEAYFAHAEPVAAIAAFSRSLALASGIGDKSYESENLMMIGWACTGQMGLADYPRALSNFDAALAIARSADLQWHMGPTLIGRAHAYMARGQYGLAWADLQEALPQLEALHLVRYQIMAHDTLGCLSLDLNQPAQALQHFERGLLLANQAGIRYWLAKLVANQVIAQLRLGFPCEQTALQTAWQYAQDHSEAWMTLRCLEAQAEWALVHGDTHGCIAHAGQLLAMASGADMRELVAQAHFLCGLAWLAAKACDAACQELTLALHVSEQIGRVRLMWDCHQALARAAAAIGDERAKNKHQERAQELATPMKENLRGTGLTCLWDAVPL